MGSAFCSLIPLFDYYQQPHPIAWSSEFSNQGALYVEIGFGLGEVLIKSALENPDCNYIGLEQNWERIYKTLKVITEYNQETVLENIRILRMDARLAFIRLFREKSIKHIYSLFPCPWPKKSHTKNRLFTNEFLKLLNSRLVDSGELKVVTDYYPYVEWMKEQWTDTGFHVYIEEVSPRFNTKFEKKWRGEGQEVFYEIQFTKRDHVNISEPKDVVLKSYTLKQFNPDLLKLPASITEEMIFSDKKEKVTVVFKEKVFDPLKQLCIIETLVAEQNLTQPFRIVLKKRKEDWCLCKADNQVFLPTPGIMKTLQIVADLAKGKSSNK
ncbi:MAG: hypothetical protein H6755_02005 [Candidatus Omnitrophica bacterium]|nr:hypothetical protein [Candidatus Omnitrophota bacterium]MCB9747162.1 hypothetical protein [Candidatus Omnitrophota bacterium]